PASMPPASMPPASIRPAEPAYVPYEPPPPPPEADPSTYVIAAVSRGMLQRPAIAAHWQPATPQPPRPSRSTGLFRYPPGNLPVPSRPPRPDLDPSLYVQPAAGPSPSIRP
ncbi:MAG TPA: hypothetical protein VHM19_14605, partial [Polyangiales bacterium]|nr:hypothetical protein [Polyangiales bacterium]